jgi:ketosteroid isomerase-like protein
MFTGPFEDRMSIRERLETYSDAVCRADLDAYIACWTDDCVRRGAGGAFAGKDELRRHWVGIWQALEQMVFLTQVGAIEVDGDRATARSYCLETMTLKDGQRCRLVGQYTDQLRRVGGQWLFADRHYEVVLDEGFISAAD